MIKLTYRVELHIPPAGCCKATIREYPDYVIVGNSFNELMHKVQTELHEFLYLMATHPRSFKAPCDQPPIQKSKIGVMVYYIEVSVPKMEGKIHRHELRMFKSQWDRVDYILEHHSYFKSRGHFLTWAAMRAVDSLTSTFWDDLDEFTNRASATDLPELCGFNSVVHLTDNEPV